MPTRTTVRLRWECLPISRILTLRDAARIVGISPRSLTSAYTRRNHPRPLPVPCRVLRRASGQAYALLRLPIDHSAADKILRKGN